jgi:hypothetical protein
LRRRGDDPVHRADRLVDAVERVTARRPVAAS